LDSIRLILGIAAIKGWAVHQIDFKTAYLNSKIDSTKPIYVKQPPIFYEMDKNEYVWKLKKSLYGIGCSGRNWYDCLHGFLKTELKFKRCEKEYCLYIKHIEKNGEMTPLILAVYVDDMLIMSPDVEMIKELKKTIGNKFKIKKIGEASYILKMKIERDYDNKRIYVSQKTYIEKLLRRFNVNEQQPLPNPQDINEQLKPGDKPNGKFPYRELVGSLQYLVTGTRPDIGNSVRELSKYLTCYNELHWRAGIRVYIWINL
jgi:Reverse transcriptase (RNA-dependent DNA polymerase)